MKNRLIILIIFFITFSFFSTYASIEAASSCGSRHNWGSWSSISSTHHQRKCHNCGIKDTSTHSMQNSKCVVCKYTAPHSHYYSKATCTKAPTCSCGATSGKALGHKWSNATCTSPAKCSRCNTTQGKAPGHSWGSWSSISSTHHQRKCHECGIKDTSAHSIQNSKCVVCKYEAIHKHYYSNATCTKPATCSCGATTGNTLGHKWYKATCSSPAKCSRCQETTGEALGHNWSEATCTRVSTCSRCYKTNGSPLNHTWGNWNSISSTYHQRKCFTCTKKENALHSMQNNKCIICKYPTEHEHSYSNATCTKAATCSCGKTNGKSLGHNWINTDCSSKIKCSRCDATKGNGTLHSWGNWMSISSTHHQRSCILCGIKDTSNHSIQGSKCVVCKYEAPHKHTYSYATCTEPPTCSCGEIKGNALGHKLSKATCTSPEKCSRCQETIGEALGHDWSEATCTYASRCSRCYKTNGSKLDHAWGDWTSISSNTHQRKCFSCTKRESSSHIMQNNKCIVCKYPTEHTHNYSNATCTKAAICSCGATKGTALGHDWLNTYCSSKTKCSRCDATKGNGTIHSWGSWSSISSTHHQRNCTLCGIKDTSTHSMQGTKCIICKYDVPHKHYYSKVTCTLPATCSCGDTIGKALGHNWKEATCTMPAKCSRCYTIDGKALGHNWLKATCTMPTTCSLCNITTGKPISHAWSDWTSISPTHHTRRCFTCNITNTDLHSMQNNKCIVCKYPTEHIHDYSKANCIKPATCSCGETIGSPTAHAWGEWISISSTHHQRKCLTCNIKNTDIHSMQNNKCIVCKYANLSIKLNSTSTAYVGETIFITTSISPNNSGTYTLTWSANGVNHKLTPTSDKTSAWLRANKAGTILLTVSFKSETGKKILDSKTIQILPVDTVVTSSKMTLEIDSVTDLGVGVLKSISGNSITVLGSSVKAVSLGTSIVEDQKSNRYEILVIDKKEEIQDNGNDDTINNNIDNTTNNTTNESGNSSNNNSSNTNSSNTNSSNGNSSNNTSNTNTNKKKPSIKLEKNQDTISSYASGYQIKATINNSDNEKLTYSTKSDIININNDGFVTINRDKYVEQYGKKTAYVKITVSLESGLAKKTFTLIIKEFEEVKISKTSIALKEGLIKEKTPLIIFIGDKNEMTKSLSMQSKQPIIYYLNSTKSYDATIITVKVNNTKTSGIIEAMNNTISYIKELVSANKIDPSQIYLVAHGYGGYAAQYGTKAINQLEGYHVKNLVLLDGVQVETNNNKENIPDTTTLQEILNTKTNITLYASSYNKSKKYDIWDASIDTISYDSENKFDETNAQLTGVLLDTNTYDGWTKDNNLVQYLENLIS